MIVKNSKVLCMVNVSDSLKMRNGGCFSFFLFFQTVISLCVIGAGWMWAFLWIMSAGNATTDAERGSVVFIKEVFMQVNGKIISTH